MLEAYLQFSMKEPSYSIQEGTVGHLVKTLPPITAFHPCHIHSLMLKIPFLRRDWTFQEPIFWVNMHTPDKNQCLHCFKPRHNTSNDSIAIHVCCFLNTPSNAPIIKDRQKDVLQQFADLSSYTTSQRRWKNCRIRVFVQFTVLDLNS
jgi:hypothetical protein